MSDNFDKVFAAGWRPFIGWTCGLGLAWNFVGTPIMSSLGYPAQALQIDYLVALVIAMLGSSGVRTYEKMKGIARGGQAEAALYEQEQVPDEDEDAPWNRS